MTCVITLYDSWQDFTNYLLPAEDNPSAGVDPLRFKQMQGGATAVMKVCCSRP